MTKINAIIYSYKNKNLPQVVKSLIENTKNEISVVAIDQHPLDRKMQLHIPGVNYSHVFWDYQDSPCETKARHINETSAEYVLVMSDDVMVSSGWDIGLIDYLEENRGTNLILSGTGSVSLRQPSLFTIDVIRTQSNEFLKNGWIDRNFIFAKTNDLKSFSYPSFLKYYGEEEFLTASFLDLGFDIVSVPRNTYIDLGLRTIENLYTTYSKEHNYNLAIDKIKDSPKLTKRLLGSGIDPNKIYRLPHQNNDVSYNPNKLEFEDIDDGRKFIGNVHAIY